MHALRSSSARYLTALLLLALGAILALAALFGVFEASPSVESATQRQALPLYQTIPAAKTAELTPASSNAVAVQDTWSRSNADSENTRYSSLSQINKSNVSQLGVAWIYHSGGSNANNIQANPVIVDGVLYAPTVDRSIVAVNASTGVELWRFRPPAGKELFGENYLPAHRGLIYWPGTASYKPRLYFTANGYLYALDSADGRPVVSFGNHGTVLAKGPVAPAIYQNIIVVSDLDALDAYNVVTGKQLWRFEVDVQGLTKGLGDEIVDGKLLQYPGGSIWGGIALDESRGVVFIATGAPHPNYVGIDRLGPDKHSNSVVALDVRSGRLLWAFEDIAHDLWDLDIPAPPNLVTITHDGRRVDAVAQVTKQGNTLLLDRLSGKPLFPFRFRRAPVSTIPGERTSPYQPDLELPQPFSRQVFTAQDITDIAPQAREFALKQLRTATFGWFEPPVADRPIVYYGVHGGAEWTGAAFDPTSGMLYVSANELAWMASVTRVNVTHRRARRAIQLLRQVCARVLRSGDYCQPHAVPTEGETVFRQHCAQCHGENREGRGVAPSLLGVKQFLTDAQVSDILNHGRNAMPAISLPAHDKQKLLDFLFDRDASGDWQPRVLSPYLDGSLRRLVDEAGYPATRPPWGTLNAIDLNTGKLAWTVPLGEYDELTHRGIQKTGTENFGGATVTAGGLVFCAGTRDLNIRAFDKDNGKELWRYKLPFGGYAPPATYQVNGRQYVVIAATGGGKLGGEHGDVYVAFALPEHAPRTAQ